MTKDYLKIVNEAGSPAAELYIYGPIANERSFWDTTDGVTEPKGFKQQLKALGKKAVNIHINSNGGSVFAAHAIASQLKNYPGPTTAIIDGLAASAATIITMAADKILMPAGAMMMIHDPMITIEEPANIKDLEEYLSALKPIKDSIIAAYMERSKLPKEELATMMENTTWLTAEECLEMGFADGIQGRVKANITNSALDFGDGTKHKLNKAELSAVCAKLGLKEKEKKPMNEIQMLFSKIAAALGMQVSMENTPAESIAAPEPIAQAAEPAAVAEPAPVINAAQIAEEARMAERARIKALEALDNVENPYIHSLITAAKADGHTAEEIAWALAVAEAVKPNGASYMQALVADQAQSGSEKITAAAPVDEDVMCVERMARELQARYKGGKQ